MTCHSEKERAGATYKGGFGFHPLLCFLANTSEGLSGRLRPGNAGANTTSDHIAVLDDALGQLPQGHRYGTEILIRADSTGSAKAFLAHLRELREQGVNASFSVGTAVTEDVPPRDPLRPRPPVASRPRPGQIPAAGGPRSPS